MSFLERTRIREIQQHIDSLPPEEAKVKRLAFALAALGQIMTLLRDSPPDLRKHFHKEAIYCLAAAIRDAGEAEFRKDTLGYMKILQNDINDIFADRL